MTLQTFAAVAVVVDLALIVSACVAGFLLARGTRLPGWAGAAAMLLIIRAITVTTAHLWATPSGAESFPIVDAVIGSLALAGLTVERVRTRPRRTASVAQLAEATVPMTTTEAHVDAA